MVNHSPDDVIEGIEAKIAEMKIYCWIVETIHKFGCGRRYFL